MRLVSALIAALALVAPAPPIHEGVAPFPYVRASSSGAIYVKMVPDREKVGTCTAYRVSAAGPDVELWSISGWYSFGLQLSNDGIYLVRYGDALKPDDPLVVFYKAGEFVAQHTVRDLLADPSLPAGAEECVFSFLTGSPQFVGPSSFQVVTVEGVECTFNYQTGKLVSKLPQ